MRKLFFLALLLFCARFAFAVELNYEVAGPVNGAPVIMIHGNGGCAAGLVGPMTEMAGKGYRVYAIDSRGQGKNPPVDEYHYADMAEDTYEFIKTHKIVKPAVIGFSDGGIIGLMLALKHPRSICALVSCGANIWPDGVNWGDKPASSYSASELAAMPALRRMMYVEPQMKFEDLAGIRIPVLVLAGEHDLIREEHTRGIAEHIRGSELNIIPGAHHGDYIMDGRVTRYADTFFWKRNVFKGRGYATYSCCLSPNSQYSAFGDIIKYEGLYYTTFREGPDHAPTHKWDAPGVVRILCSPDCRNWTLACTISNKWFDLRDPHFCVSPVDGSLLCYYALYAAGNPWPEPTKTMVAVLEPSGLTLSVSSVNHVYCGEYSKYWIWNITREDSLIYGVGYWENGSKPVLVKSADGFNFEVVSEIPFLGNEASINIIGGRVYSILRSQTDAPAAFAVSSADKTSWTVSQMGSIMHCPVAVPYKNYLLTCVRVVTPDRNGDVVLGAIEIGSACRASCGSCCGSCCARPKFVPLTTLEYHNFVSNCAYAGMLIDGSVLRIVYYAESAGRYSSPDIYYQEYPISMIEEMLK